MLHNWKEVIEITAHIVSRKRSDKNFFFESFNKKNTYQSRLLIFPPK